MKNGVDVFNDLWKKDILPMICGERVASVGHPVDLRAVFSFAFWEGRSSMLAELDSDLQKVVATIPPKPELTAANGYCAECKTQIAGSIPGRIVCCPACGNFSCCKAR